MLILGYNSLQLISDEVEAAFPREACGLLLGFVRPSGNIEVTSVFPSKNVANDSSNSFEIDPALRFRLMRESAANSIKSESAVPEIVGHYHSHPNGAPVPSDEDIRMALEPELVWLIASVIEGKCVECKAYLLASNHVEFSDIGLHCAPRGERNNGF